MSLYQWNADSNDGYRAEHLAVNRPRHSVWATQFNTYTHNSGEFQTTSGQADNSATTECRPTALPTSTRRNFAKRGTEAALRRWQADGDTIHYEPLRVC